MPKRENGFVGLNAWAETVGRLRQIVVAERGKRHSNRQATMARILDEAVEAYARQLGLRPEGPQEAP